MKTGRLKSVKQVRTHGWAYSVPVQMRTRLAMVVARFAFYLGPIIGGERALRLARRLAFRFASYRVGVLRGGWGPWMRFNTLEEQRAVPAPQEGPYR